jgi:uncharacterized protein YdaU (DUF1376 family)
MPIYPADYLAKTIHLTASESGAYLHLIMYYWRNNGLPSDVGQIARISRLTTKEWDRSKKTLEALFAPGWVDKQLDAEIVKMVDLSEKRRRATNIRWGRMDTHECSHVGTNDHTPGMPLHTSHFTQSPGHVDEVSLGGILTGSRGGVGALDDAETDDVFDVGGMA